MSGFLHQLAARSLGRAPAARPRAALPYAAPAPETPAPDLAAVAPEAAAVAAAPLLATGRDASGPASETAAAPPAERHTAEPIPPSHPRAASAEIPTLPSVVPAVSAPRQRPEPSHEGERSATPRPAIGELQAPTAAFPRTHPTAIQLAADSRPASDGPASGLLDLESLVSRLVGQATSHNLSSPDGTPSPSTAVVPANDQPLRPGHASHRPAERRDAVETASPAADAAPEVHITIGRLEVNPPTRPTPPAPRPRAPAPLSLSDYLASRAGGRS